jgi:hypothetical protein
MTPPIDWDDPEWGGGVHVADWAPDPKHADETDDR